MNPNTLASGAVWVIFLIMALFCIAWYIVEYGKKQAKYADEYDLLYNRIKYVIRDHSVNDMNYDYIERLIERLRKMKYKNREKTTVLVMEFFMKYKDIAKQRNELNS